MIERLKVSDAEEASTFLQRAFTLDALAGGKPDHHTPKALAGRAKKMDVWVCKERGKIVGMLQGARGFTERDSKILTFNLFNLYAVDHTLSPAEMQRVAHDLTLFAANDLRDNGGMCDLIRITGPFECRGASWCLKLGMEAQALTGRWESEMPFSEIWERLEAVRIR